MGSQRSFGGKYDEAVTVWSQITSTNLSQTNQSTTTVTAYTDHGLFPQ